jgi:hypothetical protein
MVFTLLDRFGAMNYSACMETNSNKEPTMNDHGITTTMSRRTALAICSQAGLSPDERGRYGGKYWALDEAVGIALVLITGRTVIGHGR